MSISHRKLAKFVLYLCTFTYALGLLFQWGVALTSEADSGGDSSLVAVLIQLPVVAVGIPALFIFRRDSRQPMFSALFKTFIIISVLLIYSTFVGWAVYDYEPRYVAGDWIRYLICWINFFVIVSALHNLKEDFESTVSRLIFLFTLIGVMDAALIFLRYSMAPGIKIHSLGYIFLVLYFMYSKIRRHGLLSAVIFVLGVVAMFFTGKRGTLVAVLGAFIGVWLLSRLAAPTKKQRTSGITISRKAVKGTLGAIASIMIFGMAYSFLPNDSKFVQQVNYFYDNFYDMYNNYMQSEEVDGSYQSRINELNNALEFYRSNESFIAFGAGLGAEVPMVYDSSVYTESGRMHHLHIGWAAYFLRGGLIGLLLIAGYFFVMGVLCLKFIRSSRRNDSDAKILTAFVIFEFLISFKSSFMFQAYFIFTPLMLGICMVKARSRSRRKLEELPLFRPVHSGVA